MPAARVNASAAFAAAGLLLNVVWCTLVGHAPGFARPLAGFGATVNPRVFFLVGILLVGVAFTAAPRWLRERGAFVWPAAPLLAAFGTACFIVAPDQAALPVGLVSSGGLIAFGMGYLWLTAHFILLLARTQPFSRAVACIAASLMVEPAAVLLVEQLMSPEAQMLLVVAMPFFSAFLFRCSRRCALSAAVDGGGRAAPGVAQGSRRNALVLVATAALLLATVRSLSFVGLWGGAHTSTPDAQSMMASPLLWFAYAAFLAVFAYFAVVRSQGRPRSVRFQPALLVIILTLCVSLMLMDDALVSPAVTDTMMRLNDSFSHLLFWSLVVVLINETGMPSYRAIGASAGLYAGASVVWVLFLGSAGATGNPIAAGVIYAASLVTMRFGDSVHAGDLAGAPAAESRVGLAPQDPAASSSAALVASAIEARCSEVAAEYALSPRETEILNLLAQGRTRAYIQEELVLAENTVKTHVAHIYAKLAVKDRQEMIDVLLGARPSA